MRFLRTVVPILVLPLALPVALAAQAPDSSSLRGKHMLVASLGLTGSREAAASAGGTSARATGPLGSLAYTHFVTPRAGFEIAAAVFDADASASGAGTSATAVTAFLVGLTLAPTSLALGTSVRPFISAAVGSYTRHMAEASGGATTGARSQSQAGARVGAGINFLVARHFAMRLAGGYDTVAPFDDVTGLGRDPSGLSLSFGLALTWGGR